MPRLRIASCQINTTVGALDRALRIARESEGALAVFFESRAVFYGFSKMRERFLRDEKLFVFGPVEVSFRFLDRIFARIQP